MVLVFLFLGSLLSRIKDTQYRAKDHQPPDINYFAEILLLLACFHIYLVSLTKCIVMKNQINIHGNFIIKEIQADLFYYDQQEGYICYKFAFVQTATVFSELIFLCVAHG